MVTYTLKVSSEQAPIVFELFQRAAISGDKAHLLADLYSQAKVIANNAANEQRPTGVRDIGT